MNVCTVKKMRDALDAMIAADPKVADHQFVIMLHDGIAPVKDLIQTRRRAPDMSFMEMVGVNTVAPIITLRKDA